MHSIIADADASKAGVWRAEFDSFPRLTFSLRTALSELFQTKRYSRKEPQSGREHLSYSPRPTFHLVYSPRLALSRRLLQETSFGRPVAMATERTALLSPDSTIRGASHADCDSDGFLGPGADRMEQLASCDVFGNACVLV